MTLTPSGPMGNSKKCLHNKSLLHLRACAIVQSVIEASHRSECCPLLQTIFERLCRCGVISTKQLKTFRTSRFVHNSSKPKRWQYSGHAGGCRLDIFAGYEVCTLSRGCRRAIVKVEAQKVQWRRQYWHAHRCKQLCKRVGCGNRESQGLKDAARHNRRESERC